MPFFPSSVTKTLSSLPTRAALTSEEISNLSLDSSRERSLETHPGTWFLALAAGVPLELVQRVTGHRTVAVVLKHYFRPGREDFRQVLVKAMPKMLGEGSPGSAKDEMRRVVEGMTERTWRRDRQRLLEWFDKS